MVCVFHWEICGSNIPIHLGEFLPGMYPEGQTVLESHGRKRICVSAEREQDPEVLQRLVELLVFVSIFPTRFQVCLRQGLCLIHLFSPVALTEWPFVSTC